MQMVACDLDGTIVCTGGRISERTLAALHDCEQRGITVVFVTGRPVRWMPPIVAMTGHRGLALCSNGAVVLDLATGQVVQSHGLTPATVLELAARLRERLPAASFALETLQGYRREPEYPALHEDARNAATGTLEELLVDGPTVVKVLCRQSGPDYGQFDSDQMLVIARRVLGDLVEVVHSDPVSHMLEIAAPGVTKASALAWLAGRLGVLAAEVVAFGDMPNDVPMLLWAGDGYAMSGGHPDAVAAAAKQAPPCAEDGVAQVLERLLAARSAEVG